MHAAVFEAGWKSEELIPRHREVIAQDLRGKGTEVIGIDRTLTHHERGAKIFGVKRAYDYVDKRMSNYQTVVTATLANREMIDGLEVVIQIPDYQAVVEIFEKLGLNWKTFVKTRLPLLKLPSVILEALRQGELEYTKASLISRLKDENQRSQLLKEVIEQNLSLSQIKERIKQLSSPDTNDSSSLKLRFSKIYTNAKKSKVWNDPKKQKQLEKLVTDFKNKFALLLENN